MEYQSISFFIIYSSEWFEAINLDVTGSRRDFNCGRGLVMIHEYPKPKTYFGWFEAVDLDVTVREFYEAVQNVDYWNPKRFHGIKQ